MDLRKHYAKQLASARKALQSLDEVVQALENDMDDAYALGIDFSAASFDLGARGEWALVREDPTGWGLLYGARRARALAVALAPSVVSSGPGALAILEAIQWGEIDNALAIARHLERGYKGEWHVTGRVVPSATEAESLAFALLRQVTSFQTKFAKKFVPLSDFADVASPKPVKDVEECFGAALERYKHLCADRDGVVPRGARLTCAPIFACVEVRRAKGLNVPREVDHELWSAPFKDFRLHRKARPPAAIRKVFISGARVAKALGVSLRS